MGKIGSALRVLGLTMLLTLTLITTGILKVNAQSTQELAYDDGEADAGLASATGRQMAVKFSLPYGWSKAVLLEAKYYFYECNGSKVPIGVHVYNGARNEIASLQIYPPTMNMAWYDVDLSSLNIVVDGDFYISIEYNSGNPFLGLDGDPPIDQRSYAIDEYGTWYGPDAYWDYMIRAVIGQPAEVIFDQSGVGSDYTGPVLNVDGVNYTAADLPRSFTWVVGSTHTFEFYEALYVSANERYGWIGTEGLSTYLSGEVIVPSGGGVVKGKYTKQYLVIVTASPSEAIGGTFKANFTSGVSTFYGKTGRTPYDIWANMGTWVNVTSPQPSIDSYKFSHYSPSNSAYVDGPKTITLVYTKPPVGGIIVSPEENLDTVVNNAIIIVALAIVLISTLTIAARIKLRR